MRRAVFFDRDGVLNLVRLTDGRPKAPLSLVDFEIDGAAPGAVQAVRDAGFFTFVATNQPELATGELAPATLDAMHAQLSASMPFHAIYVCPHRDADGCACHKPRPGLLERAREEWDLDLTRSYLIGDRWRDIGAGAAVGCETVLLSRPYSGDCQPTYAATDINDAVTWILGRGR
jgi:D-glycero-D-manno-heptose 1,7-bisphosphate phosphatase